MAKSAPNRAKAETLSLRISPDLKFGLELLSKIEERSLTTQVERSLKELFNGSRIGVDYLGAGEITYKGSYPELYFYDLLAFIYTVDAPLRLFRTAILLPEALSHKDRALVELISLEDHFHGDEDFIFGHHPEYEEMLAALVDAFFSVYKPLNFSTIRKNWARLNEAAEFAIEHGHYPAEVDWLD